MSRKGIRWKEEQADKEDVVEEKEKEKNEEGEEEGEEDEKELSGG